MDLPELRRDLQRLVDNTEPLQHAIGQFGKTTALDQVQVSLGSDRAFSGWKSTVPLGAGYDLGTPVVLNLRPAGMWVLADKGRRRTKKIRPKRRTGRNGRPAAIRIGSQGYFASSTSTPSRGLNTIRNTETAIERGIAKAAEEGVNEMIRQAGF